MQHDNENPNKQLNTTVTLSNSCLPDVEGLPDPFLDEDGEFSTPALDRTFDLGNVTKLTFV